MGARRRSILLAGLPLLLAAFDCGPPQEGVLCAREMQRAFEQVAFAQRATIEACLRRSDGAPAAVATCVDSDPLGGAIARAQQRSLDAETRFCDGDLRPPIGVTSAAQTNAAATAAGLSLANGLFGLDLDAAARARAGDPAAARCQSRVLDRAGLCSAKFLRAYGRCAGGVIASGADDPFALVACKEADSGGAVAQACDVAIAAAIDGACAGLEPAPLFPGCAGDLAACVRAHARRSASTAVNAAGALCEDVLVGTLPEDTLLQCFEPPAQEPVVHAEVPLPEGVSPATADWSDAGESLLLTFTAPEVEGTQVATVRPDGSDFACLTCGSAISGNLKPVGLFRDGRRVLVAGPNNPSPRWRVLECMPSLLDCQTSVLLPIQLPTNPDPTTPILQYRVPWVTGDGAWFVWTEVRLRGPGGNVSAMGRLVREAARYVVTDARVIAPPFDLDLLGTDPDLWRNFTQAFEAKGGSMRGGIDWVEAGTPNAGQYDAQVIDLATGAMRRVTHHPDHDEAIKFSSDEQWAVVHSARTDNRVGFLGLLPRPPYIDWLAFSVHFVGIAGQPNDGISPGGNPNERDCYVDHWLLDRWAERGDYIGQRLSRPTDGWESIGGNGQGFDWSPDGTKIALIEQRWKRLTAPGEVQQARLRIASFPNRAPIDPADVVPLVPTPEPAWAVRYEDYTVPDTAGVTVIPGNASGTATIHNGLASALAGSLRVVYDDYSDDGLSFLDGSESLDIPEFINLAVHYEVDLVLTGLRQGSMQGSITYDFVSDQNLGEVVSVLDGVELRGPTTCYDAGLIPIP